MCSSNNNVSFTGLIRPTSLSKYTKATEDVFFRANIQPPWSYKDTKKVPKGMSMDVFDCSAGGIVNNDTKEVVLFHLCPENKENFDFEKIEKYVMSKVDGTSENLQAFIIGSKKIYADSEMLFMKLKSMMQRHKIPTTVIKGNQEEKTHILYDAKSDEWLITNNTINRKILNGETDSKKILEDCFDEVSISEKDKI